MALPVLSANYKYVAIFIMLICFCAHITFFSIGFAKYETSTNYDAVDSHELNLPQLIICMPFEQFVGSEKAITDTQHLLLLRTRN